MKPDFSTVVLVGECGAMLDEPNGWTGSWVLCRNSQPK